MTLEPDWIRIEDAAQIVAQRLCVPLDVAQRSLWAAIEARDLSVRGWPRHGSNYVDCKDRFVERHPAVVHFLWKHRVLLPLGAESRGDSPHPACVRWKSLASRREPNIDHVEVAWWDLSKLLRNGAPNEANSTDGEGSKVKPRIALVEANAEEWLRRQARAASRPSASRMPTVDEMTALALEQFPKLSERQFKAIWRKVSKEFPAARMSAAGRRPRSSGPQNQIKSVQIGAGLMR